MPEQTTAQTGITPRIDLAQQNKTVNDVLGIAAVAFFVLCACLFLFRRLSRTAKGAGCSGCSSGGCPMRDHDGGMGCQSASIGHEQPRRYSAER